MALVTRFEDLQAWQAARRLAGLAHGATRPKAFPGDRGLADQLRRAATSAVTNIAEGFASGSHVEFQRFLRYAIRSAAEVQSCLYLAADQGCISDGEFKRIYESAERVKGLCSALVRRLAVRPPRQRPKTDRVSEPPTEWIVDQPRADRCAPTVSRNRPATPPFVSTSTRQHVHTSTRGGAGIESWDSST